MRIYYDNLIEDATLTPNASGTNQDVDVLKGQQLSNTFQFGEVYSTLVIALTEEENVKEFVVDIGNLSATGTYTLEGNSSDSWDSPAVSYDLTITDTMMYTNVDSAYRFWRLVINDVLAGLPELGYIMITGSAYLQMPGIDPEAELNYNSTSESSISVSGQVYGDGGYDYLDTAFTFPQIYETETDGINGVKVAGRQEILSFWQTVSSVTPVWIMLWEKNLDEYPPVFCIVNQQAISFKKLAYGKYYSTSIAFREVK